MLYLGYAVLFMECKYLNVSIFTITRVSLGRDQKVRYYYSVNVVKRVRNQSQLVLAHKGLITRLISVKLLRVLLWLRPRSVPSQVSQVLWSPSVTIAYFCNSF